MIANNRGISGGAIKQYILSTIIYEFIFISNAKIRFSFNNHLKIIDQYFNLTINKNRLNNIFYSTPRQSI